MKNNLKFIKREAIDDQRWNDLVCKNSNFPYAFTWWLDVVCSNWGGIY